MGSLVENGFQIAAAEESKKGGGAIPQLPKRSLREKILDSSTLDILHQEQRLVNDALAQGAALQPEMYRALGFEPVYAEEGGGQEAFTEAANRVAALEAEAGKRQELKARLSELKSSPKGTGKKARAVHKERRQVQKELNRLPTHKGTLKSLKKARAELGQLQTLPRRIIGVKPLAEAADPTGSPGGKFRAAFELENESLTRALQGDLPIDPTLIRAFDEKEQALREQLRRQFGPDFESADAAREILSNFDRERAEAFQQFNREQIQTFADITNRRAGLLSDLTTARLSQLAEPVRQQLGRAGSLAAVNQDIRATTQQRQNRRVDIFNAQQTQFSDRAFNTQMKAAGLASEGKAIGQIVNTLIAAAAGGAAGAGLTGGGASQIGGGGLSGFTKGALGNLSNQAISQSQAQTRE